VRASFGTQGAKLPALLRAIVACGWYGIQTWLGGSAIYTLLNILTGNALHGAALPVVGISFGQLACFLAFWALQLYFILHGTDSIRWLESWSAPIKVVMCVALVWWATSRRAASARCCRRRRSSSRAARRPGCSGRRSGRG
jgi:NCS1 family nucleobase:cation symporter-1